MLNSQYDKIILEDVYLQPCIPPNCSEEGEELLRHYKAEFDHQVQPVLSSPPSNGYFLDSCLIHCQTYDEDRVWSQYAIYGRTMAQTFGDWYYDRGSPGSTRLKDCDTDYPCNPTCPDERRKNVPFL